MPQTWLQLKSSQYTRESIKNHCIKPYHLQSNKSPYYTSYIDLSVDLDITSPLDSSDFL